MNYNIDIPFPVLRALLPPDGQRLSFLIGQANKWPQNPAGFLRDETAEISFGKGIRAKPTDRGHEVVMSPGISCGSDVLLLQGGWTLHKAEPGVDFFDGTFKCKVRFSVTNGVADIQLQEFALEWNAGLLARLAHLDGFINSLMQSKIKSEIADKFVELNKVILDTVHGVKNRFPNSPIAPNDISVLVSQDVIRVMVNVN